MFKELAIISDIVHHKLNPRKDTEATPELLEEWLSLIYTEEQNIKCKIAESVLHLPNETHIEIYIQNYQKRLTSLANQLYAYNNGEQLEFNFQTDEPLSPVKLRSIAYQTLEDLIEYLNSHFGKFFLKDERPPQRLILIATAQFTQNILDLQELHSEPDKCLDSLISVLSDYIQNPEKITFHKLSYLHTLIQEILNFNHQNKEANFPLYVEQKLFYMNFNCEIFVLCFTSAYEKEIEKIENINKKIEKLSWYWKRITQMPYQNVYQYDKQQKSLRDQVSNWLTEEMCYHEKRLILSNIQIPVDKTRNAAGYKLQTSLSVPQLAYFLRILVELEIIKYPNDKELLKFYAEHTSTKKAESISPESLRIKFYDIEDTTRDEVKSLIIRILNYIQNQKRQS